MRAQWRSWTRRLGWLHLRGISVYGAPLYVHWSVSLGIALILALTWTNPVFALLFVASYLAVIVVHELGHAVVARRFGYAIESVAITAWHGWCGIEAPQYEWHAVLVAWGGVLAQCAIAVPVLLLAAILADRDWGYWTPIIVFLGYGNLVVAAVNLLPGDALDGRTAWRIVPLLRVERRARRAVHEAERRWTKRS